MVISTARRLALWLGWALCVTPGLAVGQGAAPSAEPAAQAQTRAWQIAQPADLLDGPEATGAVGDFEMTSPALKVVISAPRPDGRGGRLIDLAPVGGVDTLGEIAPAFDAAGRRQPIITDVQVIQPGGQGAAIVQARGRDALDEQIEITLDYVLAPDTPYLKIITTVHHRGRSHYPDFAAGRFIRWGALTPFAPGVGADPVGRRAHSPWIGAGSPEGAVVLSPYDGLIESFHGRGWTVTRETEAYLKPGATLTLETWIWVDATGGVAGPVAKLHAQRRSVIGQIEGTARDAAGPVAGAQIRFVDAKRRPIHQARTDEAGRFEITLPPGRYSATASAPGRADVSTNWFRVVAGKRARVDVKLGAPGALVMEITDEAGASRPARIRLTQAGQGALQLHGGDAPRIVEGVTAVDDQIFLAEGKGRWPMPPGRYTAHISSGPAWGVATETITVEAGAEAQLTARLSQEMDTGAWRAIDPRAHTRQTVASDISAPVRQMTCAIEGVHAIMTGGPLRPGAGALIVPALFTEADAWGWFAAAPLQAPAGALWPPQSPPRPDGRLAALKDLPGGPARVILDPRNPKTGYFEHFAFQPAEAALPRGGFSLDFELLEIASGALQARLERVAADYQALIARAAISDERPPRPLASSGITGLGPSPCGLPRTWLHDRRALSAGGLSHSLRRGPMVASFGPLLDLQIRGEVDRRAQIEIQAPRWHRPTTLTLRVDGVRWRRIKLKRGRGPLHETIEAPLAGVEGRWITAEVDGPPGARAIYGLAVRPFAVTAPVALTAP